MATKDYSAAIYETNVTNYNSIVAGLQPIESAYGSYVGQAGTAYAIAADIQSQASAMQAQAKALSIIGMSTAAIGLSGRAQQLYNSASYESALKALESAEKLITTDKIGIQLYYTNSFTPRDTVCDQSGCRTVYGSTLYSTVKNKTLTYKTYQEYISLLNSYSAQIKKYRPTVSISFSVSYGGSSSTSNLNLTPETYATITQWTLSKLKDYGVISDNVYKNLTTKIGWQLALAYATKSSVEASLSAVGLIQSPLGYINTSTYYSTFQNSDMLFPFYFVELYKDIGLIYESYKQVEALEEEYDSKRKEFNDYIEYQKSKSDKDFNDIMSYAVGDYYKKFAGQDLFNIGLASKNGYIPMSAQLPSWGIVGQPYHNEDEFISLVMSKDRNSGMAGSSGFLKIASNNAMIS